MSMIEVRVRVGTMFDLTAFSAEGHSTKHPGINDLPDVIVHDDIQVKQTYLKRRTGRR
jgi:hypothetical protein